MNISRDIVKDLVAVYLAGDASADTRALVESYLKTDPELARDVEAARATTLGLPPARTPTAEKQALDATRQQLKNRTSTLVVAMQSRSKTDCRLQFIRSEARETSATTFDVRSH